MTHHTTPHRGRRALAALTLIATALVAQAEGAIHAGAEHDAEDVAHVERNAKAKSAPTLRIRTVVSSLDHPWDITFAPGGQMLFTERDRGHIHLRGTGGELRLLTDDVPGLWVSGETGLMAILADPNFGRNRRFYTCHGHTSPSGTHDVRVMAWRANDALTSAQVSEPIVRGIQASSGRHGGCRLRIGPGGGLFVGTGDAALTGTARDKTSLAGKVLRVNRQSGNAVPSNPFFDSSNRNARKIFTFGHRNVQALARRPGGQMWSVEHGTYRDDEVNLLHKGGDYGWQAGPGYDESPPMTDFSLPGPQIGARWSSGNPTIAPSGATWLRGNRWQSWQGALAVAVLKDREMRIMRFQSDGDLVSVVKPGALDETYGRLRAAQLGPNNVLYLSTDNGAGADRILAVSTT